MNGSFLTAEVESLIQGYVDGELTAPECARLRELLEASPDLITPLLENLRNDALIREAVSQTANVDFAIAANPDMVRGEEAAVPSLKSQYSPRFGVWIALAASAAVLMTLAVFFGARRASRPIVPPGSVTVTGTILYEYWAGIPGANVRDLTSHPDFQRTPTGRQLLPQFEAPSNRAQDYGARVRGYLDPPATGDYLFWIASDDASELWLSGDESASNRRRICFVDTWAPPREWNWRPSQQSQPVHLEAGHRYYIEALHKQGGAGDSLAVAWQAPGGAREIIPGRALSPFSQSNADTARTPAVP